METMHKDGSLQHDATSAPDADMNPARQSNAATILIVDDGAANRRLLSTLLKYEGYQVFDACDGREGLELASRVHPQIVISDILMPSMDGYEFVRQLRANAALSDIPVIFYTAHYLEREAYRLAEACGVARVLIKPGEPADVLNAVSQLLQGAPAPLRCSANGAAFDREHLSLITNKLSIKAQELHSANSRLEALTALNLQLAWEHDPHLLLDKVCLGARRLFGAKYAVLAVNEKRVAESRYFTTSGLPSPECLTQPRNRRRIPGRLGRVFAKCRSWRSNDEAELSAGTVLPADYPPVHASSGGAGGVAHAHLRMVVPGRQDWRGRLRDGGSADA